MKIIDNFLPKKVFKQISQIVKFDLPYYYKTDNAYKVANDLYHFLHLFYYDNEVRITFFYPVIKPLLEKIKPFTLIRAKANCYPSTEKIFKHGVHIDHEHPHHGMIFYINTNNGFTILEDGTEVASVANRALIFDSGKNHQSTTCTDQDVRMNININWI